MARIPIELLKSEVVSTIINGTTKLVSVMDNATMFDERYLKPKYWKYNNFGGFENTWFRFYLGDDDKSNVDLAEENSEKYFENPLPILDFENQNSVVVFGVSVNISKSPRIIKTNVSGFNGAVYQHFNTDTYKIQVTFNESGPIFWQQNSKNIIKLLNILESPQLRVSNPQLELIYNINRAVVTNYSIGQDPRFYSRNNISITLESDNGIDIIQKTK